MSSSLLPGEDQSGGQAGEYRGGGRGRHQLGEPHHLSDGPRPEVQHTEAEGGAHQAGLLGAGDVLGHRHLGGQKAGQILFITHSFTQLRVFKPYRQNITT